jgi:hypothetical protein
MEWDVSTLSRVEAERKVIYNREGVGGGGTEIVLVL